MALPAELEGVSAQYGAAEADARALAAGLSEDLGIWQPSPTTWSVALCLDHIATTNRVYLEAMQAPIGAARAAGKLRRRAALPGVLGGLFARMLEPPIKNFARVKAQAKVLPRQGLPLTEGLQAFLTAQQQLQAFVTSNADLDLASIHFPNPFIRGLNFSIASALQIMAAHERRHLWQAWRTRRQAEEFAASGRSAHP
jgi:hypothetical protein